MSKSETTIDNYISYSLAAAHRKLHANLNRDLKELGVQVESWRVMHTLRNDDQYTMTELADIVLMNPPAFTKLVDRMVADGLVQRQLGEEDNRRVYLQLTKLGMQNCKKIMLRVNAHDAEITKSIGEKKATMLREALETLV